MERLFHLSAAAQAEYKAFRCCWWNRFVFIYIVLAQINLIGSTPVIRFYIKD